MQSIYFLGTLGDEASSSLLDPLCGFVFVGLLLLLFFCGGSESVFSHSNDHHELWSLWNWQSGSWVATISVADSLRGEKMGEITCYPLLKSSEGTSLKVIVKCFCVKRVITFLPKATAIGCNSCLWDDGPASNSLSTKTVNRGKQLAWLCLKVILNEGGTPLIFLGWRDFRKSLLLANNSQAHKSQPQPLFPVFVLS